MHLLYQQKTRLMHNNFNGMILFYEFITQTSVNSTLQGFKKPLIIQPTLSNKGSKHASQIFEPDKYHSDTFPFDTTHVC